MMKMLASTVVPIIIKEGLTEENIENAVKFITANSKKLGSRVLEYLKERKINNAASKENEGSNSIPADVQDEVQSSLREILESAASPIYMGGIAFFCERPMNDDVKETLVEILTNINEDTDQLVWENEQDAECQRVVDDFLWGNYGRSLNEHEKDYCIGDDFLYLNLACDDDSDYFRLYDGAAIRCLADALNHLLGDRYLARFTVY